MSALEIPTPEIRFGRPGQAGVWLHKRIGGCGGLEVNYVTPKNLVSNDDYYYEQFKSGQDDYRDHTRRWPNTLKSLDFPNSGAQKITWRANLYMAARFLLRKRCCPSDS